MSHRDMTEETFQELQRLTEEAAGRCLSRSYESLDALLDDATPFFAAAPVRAYLRDKEIPQPAGMQYEFYLVPSGLVAHNAWGVVCWEIAPALVAQGRPPWILAIFYALDPDWYTPFLDGWEVGMIALLLWQQAQT